jgi:hypothetical protein
LEGVGNISIAGALAEIRTQHLRNTKLITPSNAEVKNVSTPPSVFLHSDRFQYSSSSPFGGTHPLSAAKGREKKKIK